MTPESVCQLCEEICKAMVAYPDKLKLLVSKGNSATSITITAHAADVRRLIGAKGSTFMALKNIIGCLGEAIRHQVVLTTVLDGGGDRSELPPFKMRPDWNAELVVDLLDRAIAIMDGDAYVDLKEPNSDEIHARRVTIRSHPSSGRIERQLGNLQVLFNAVAMANGGHLLVDSAAL